MPCDTVTTVRLDTANMDIETMKRALERMELDVVQYGDMLSGSWGRLFVGDNGRLASNELTSEQVYREYSLQVGLDTAEMCGWTITKLDEEGEYVYEFAIN